MCDYPTERDLLQALRRYTSKGLNKQVFATNIHVLDSPWECDAIVVRTSGYWVEYECKLSVADFKADFRKKLCSWKADDFTKHDLYAGEHAIDMSELRGRGQQYIIPKPAEFNFVCPAGLITKDMVPSHCGLIMLYGDRLKTEVLAPRLKKPTKLSYKQLFNIAAKVA